MNIPLKEPKQTVMDAIRKGKVHMRPRWHFVLLSTFSLVGALIVFFTLLYLASLAAYFLRDTGTLYAPDFGGRGWWVLLHSLPWLLIGLLGIFVIVLEVLVRRYAFVYKKPLLVSVFGIFAVVLVGGFLIAQTPFHRTIMISVRRGALPPPVGAIYAMMRSPLPEGVYRGKVIAVTKDGLLIMDEGGAGTTSVIVTGQTRLPDGGAFSAGERVIVIGNSASGTVRAFGIRDIGGYSPQ